MNFECIHQAELNFMTDLQALKGPALNQCMIFMNHVDAIPLYALVIIIAWFAYKKRFGIQLLVIFILSAIINQDFKILFGQPRPFHLNPDLALIAVPSFGFPSGAAQMSMAIFGLIALEVKKLWCWALTVAFLLLVGFSRVYLGAHFPTDVLGGWVIGAVLLATVFTLFPRLERFVKKLSQLRLIGLTLLASFLLALCSLSTEVSKVFLGMGIAIGLIYAPRLPDTKHVRQKISRSLFALLGVYALFALSSFPFAFLLLVGLWISFGIPLLLTKDAT